MPRKPNLTEDERASMRRIRQDNPQMPYRTIGRMFGVTPACVCQVLSQPAPPPKVIMHLPGPVVENPYTSFSPDPAAMRGGRAYPLRRLSAPR
jgi:hypothetical protein